MLRLTEMVKMQIIMAILALLMWVEAASAQKTYSLSVSRHRDTPALSENDVKLILAEASKMLRKTSGHVDKPDDVACNVTFTLKGPVRTFASPDTPAIVDEDHIEAVHRVDSKLAGVDFHVKVVSEISNFCRIPNPSGFNGCSYPPKFHSIIVVHPKMHTNPSDPSGPPLPEFPDHLLWAHEFGHLTGLGHRNAPRALMTPCSLAELSDVSDDLVKVNRAECRCLLSGLNSCPLPNPIPCS